MKKTFLCFSLSFALLASALSPSFSADVFAKAKLAKTKITLTVGQKKKITLLVQEISILKNRVSDLEEKKGE